MPDDRINLGRHAKAFKAYDIRGVYPTELDESLAFVVGQGFAQKIRAKKVVVGRDMRIGSFELSRKVIEGLTSQGVDVDDIGMVPIDAVYFCVGKFGYDGGIMVTASHNPKEYNGLKMAVRSEQGLGWVRGAELFDFMKSRSFEPRPTPGSVREREILPAYIEHVLSFVDTSKIRPFTIVIDAGNGMAGKVIPPLFAKLPCRVVPLNFELDGNFPAHPSNPLLPESQVQAREKVLEAGADLGVIMDGDADRLFFMTEKGDFVRADTTLLVLAKYFLERHPGAGIAYNVICSKAVPERVREWGGRPLRSAVGYVFVARKMKEHDGIMGGEVSGHYSFRNNFYADSGFIALLTVLAYLSERDEKLSKVVAGMNPYWRADEVNLTVQDMPGTIAKIKERFADGKQDELDGVTVEYNDWWFNVRPSNTEPLLRITVEGNTREIMEKRQREVVAFVKGAGA